MVKHETTMVWITAENESEWDRLWTSAHSDGNVHRRRSRSRWATASLVLLLVGMGSWVWPTAQPDALRSKENETVLAQSLSHDVAYDRSMHATSVESDLRASLETMLRTNESPTNGEIEIANMELSGHRAAVSIVVRGTENATDYRQTLFYRNTATGWIPAEPDVELWGAERSLETPYFVFHFRHNDEATVMAVAPQIDALYTTMHRNFGLPMVPSDEKLRIEISVTQEPGNAVRWFGVPDHIILPSPARYRAPADITDAELLEQSIALPILSTVLARADTSHAIPLSWDTMVNALSLWQMWNTDLPLSAWRGDIVRWLYNEFAATNPNLPLVLPDRYAEFCKAHKLWLSSPAQIGIPLLCAELQWEELLLVQWRRHDSLMQLDRLSGPLPHYASWWGPPLDNHPGQTVALATLVDYAVATHGRDRLPFLLAGLSHYPSWKTLIPAVYGISSEEFEAGWQAYLASQYGVSPIHAVDNIRGNGSQSQGQIVHKRLTLR